MSDRKRRDRVFMNMLVLYVLLVFSVFLCMYGIHEIDNAWNLKYMNVNYEENLIDCAVNQCYSADQVYMNGQTKLELGIFCVFITSIILGYFSHRR